MTKSPKQIFRAGFVASITSEQDKERISFCSNRMWRQYFVIPLWSVRRFGNTCGSTESHRQFLNKRRANSTLKLTAPAFGTGLKPLVQLQFGRRHAAWQSSRAAQTRRERAAGVPLGFGTWALALHLSVNPLARPKVHRRAAVPFLLDVSALA